MDLFIEYFQSKKHQLILQHLSLKVSDYFSNIHVHKGVFFFVFFFNFFNVCFVLFIGIVDTVDHGEMNGFSRQDTESSVITTRTQLTFDFHRLNVLLLRAVVKDNGLVVGRKIATATMTEAKIHANVGMLSRLKFLIS